MIERFAGERLSFLDELGAELHVVLNVSFCREELLLDLVDGDEGVDERFYDFVRLASL